ncbi:MAG: divalent-cation tolerance protein CutA [Kiritimatiellae bacterium]|nr:divalent-cation tolerance protein CutA [Kiritimatiellia bacterium]
MTDDACIILTTFPDESAAGRVLDGLLEKRLAACVQTLPIQSAYRWQGDLRRESEILAQIKTRAALYSEVEAFLRAHHPYEEPEILRVPVTGGSPGYLRWLAVETRSPSETD